MKVKFLLTWLFGTLLFTACQSSVIPQSNEHEVIVTRETPTKTSDAESSFTETPTIAVTVPISVPSPTLTLTITPFVTPLPSSSNPSVSTDGHYIVFTSDANYLVAEDTNWVSDVFVYELLSSNVERVSQATNGNQANAYSVSSIGCSISADGRFVVFSSSATNLSSNDVAPNADVYIHDRFTSQTDLISIGLGGVQSNGDSVAPCISANGQYVVFASSASNLVANDSNGFMDIFIHAQETNLIKRVSEAVDGTQSNSYSVSPVISADSSYIAFESYADNLVSNDTNGRQDIFVKNRITGEVERITTDLGGGGPVFSGDGRLLAFTDGASVIVLNLQEKAVTWGNLVRIEPVHGSLEGARWISLSEDGRYIVFLSELSNLVGDDTNGMQDIFMYDIETDEIKRINMSSEGSEVENLSSQPVISANGSYVVFMSLASLLPEDTNGVADIYLYDRNTGEITWISTSHP